MKIEQNVLEVLSSATVKGNKVFLHGELDRKLYTNVNTVLEAAGGTWNRKDKAHVFESNPEKIIDEIILTESIDIPKNDFDFFPTPKKVVDKMISIATLKDGYSILEPEAGRGAIAFECLNSGKKVQVDCFEISPESCEYLREHAVSRVVCGDFLSMQPVESAKYDVALMNPPFSNKADIKHVMHAVKFMKPIGILVAVMSSGVTFRKDKLTSEFRDFVDISGGFFEPLPEGSFKESGTMVNTVLAVIYGRDVYQ